MNPFSVTRGAAQTYFQPRGCGAMQVWITGKARRQNANGFGKQLSLQIGVTINMELHEILLYSLIHHVNGIIHP